MNRSGGFSNFFVPVLVSMVLGCLLLHGSARAQVTCDYIDCAMGYMCVEGQGCVPDGSPPFYSASPTTLSFGTVPVGASEVDSFTVCNRGASARLVITSVTSSNAVFTVSPASATLLPGKWWDQCLTSQTFHVTFSPVVGGVQGASIVLMHNASGSPDTVTVAGNDVPAPVTRQTWGQLKMIYR